MRMHTGIAVAAIATSVGFSMPVMGQSALTRPEDVGLSSAKLALMPVGWDGVGTRRFWAIPQERIAIVTMVPLIGPQAATLQRTIEAIVMEAIISQ